MDIMNLSEGIITNFVENDIDDIFKIINVSKNTLAELPSFKDKMVNKIHENIQTAMEKATLVQFMNATNIFGHNFGHKRLEKIFIKYGNNFMIDLEKYIVKGSDGKNVPTGTNLPFKNRETWVSPQYFRFKDYIETLSRTNVKRLPYIWDPMILQKFDEGFHKQPMKVSQENFGKIAIVEPNLNVIKNCMVPISICEMAYDKNKDLIKEIYCFGSKHMDKNTVFVNYVKGLNIHKNKVISYEARYPIFKMFKNNVANTIVSTQLYNEQNYVYFEALFYKRLLIHNSPMFKEVGYYYPDMNVNVGSDQLLDAIKNFDQVAHVDAYEAKLFEHSIYNKENQENTKALIEGVL
jgi:hypothetical protein